MLQSLMDFSYGKTAGDGGGLATSQAEEPLAAAIMRLGTPVLIGPGCEICSEGSPNDRLYQVLSGVVRICSYFEHGQRQISAFCFSGDLIGLEAGHVRSCNAEAVTACRLAVVRRPTLQAAAEHDATLCLAMYQAAARSLSQLQAHIALLSQKSALDRVAEFLRGSADRQVEPDVIELPMTRQDIADYLNLTIETVSRSMTQLQDLGVISLDGARRIQLQGLRRSRTVTTHAAPVRAA